MVHHAKSSAARGHARHCTQGSCSQGRVLALVATLVTNATTTSTAGAKPKLAPGCIPNAKHPHLPYCSITRLLTSVSCWGPPAIYHLPT
jgi:hypothetical protein